MIGATGFLPRNLLATSFDLDILDEHNFPIEHDASLSRADYYVDGGDNYGFDQIVFDEVLRFYEGMSETSIEAASKAKWVSPFFVERRWSAEESRYNRVITEEREIRSSLLPRSSIFPAMERLHYIFQ